VWLGSLTPALSRGEREKRAQRFGETMTECRFMTCKFCEIVQRLSPLPAGEGQGEGKASAILWANMNAKPIVKSAHIYCLCLTTGLTTRADSGSGGGALAA
jgi:hypothetical protein